MKSILFAASFLVMASCQNQIPQSIQRTNPSASSPLVAEIMDFHVSRLSGARVKISWHAETNYNDFLVMRKTGATGMFEKVGIVKPRLTDAVNDYYITDVNESVDSSFYSILQVDSKGVKYYSRSYGIEGRSRTN